MNCRKCGTECRIVPEQVGVDKNSVPIYHRIAYCDLCNVRYDIDVERIPDERYIEQKNGANNSKGNKKKKSVGCGTYFLIFFYWSYIFIDIIRLK